MRIALILTLCGIATLFVSCSTMAAYEAARKARLGVQDNPAVADSSTTTTIAPTDSGVGTLLQPYVAPVKKDEFAEKAQKDAEIAKQLVEDTRPDVSTDAAPGPRIPVLKTLIVTSQDLSVAGRVFEIYARAVNAVRVSVEAFGIAGNIASIRKVREANKYWKLWFERVRILPGDMSPSEKDVKAFYALVATQARRAETDIDAINDSIDRQRTHLIQ